MVNLRKPNRDWRLTPKTRLPAMTSKRKIMPRSNRSQSRGSRSQAETHLGNFQAPRKANWLPNATSDLSFPAPRHIRTHARTHTHTRTHAHAHTHTRTRAHTRTHTHTHTPARAPRARASARGHTQSSHSKGGWSKEGGGC